MEQHLFILGRQPVLGLAELESLYGSDHVRPIGHNAALVDTELADIPFEALGGSVKTGVVLARFTAHTGNDWKEVEKYLLQHGEQLFAATAGGKLQLGLSAYGFSVTAPRVNATGLSLKKALRKAGQSVRLVPNQEPALNSAQVFHNHLAGDKNYELLVVADDKGAIIARTTAVQDIDSYTLRDRGRPKRDTRVGMLPPKLAQIILNLATPWTAPPATLTLLDPFCGTGVVLQEALLSGYNVYGSDLEPRMIDYTGENLDWLDSRFDLTGQKMLLEQADATTHQWEPAPDFVACETYLGRPFTTIPRAETLTRNIADCNLIIKKFLTNIHDQLPSGGRLCVAVPAWQVRKNEFKHLPLIDQISDLGYNRVKFEHVLDADLLYYREDQIVARELLVITRK